MFIKWLTDGGLSIDPPKKTKKITGTRFGAILGENCWSTPFRMWCELTHTYNEPYEDNIYTLAGKTIEPKQRAYISALWDDVKAPEDVYGKDFFHLTHGDFFPGNKLFGGMWDALAYDDGKIDAVIEFKTTKRVEDWEDTIPEYYSLQAALYGWLLGVDKIVMCCSVLSDPDYINPDSYVPNANNTFTRTFYISEKYPDFNEKISYCEKWFYDYVVSGFSPKPTDADAELLKILHTEYVDPDEDLETLLTRFNELKEYKDSCELRMKAIDKEYKQIADLIKSKVTDGKKDEILKVSTDRYELTFSPRESRKIDQKMMANDGIDLDKYTTVTTNYSMTIKENNNG